MKKLIYIFSISALVLFLGACSEDKMDEINKNPNDPKDVSSEFIMPDLMTSTAFSIVGSDLAFYASVYIEHNVGVYGQLYNAERRAGEPTSGTTYNNSWNSIYRNLKNLKIVIDKCSEEGEEEGNYHTLGIAQILTAYNLAVLTDLFGDVPWSEALQPGVIYTPRLDKQEDIYSVIFKNLEDGIINLDKESNFASLGRRDLMYGVAEDFKVNKNYESDYQGLWTKFAFGLKARYTMRLSKRTPDYQAVIDFADKSFERIGDEAKYRYPTGARSPFFAFFKDRNYFGASASLNAKLVQRSDPRDTIFFKPAEKDEIDIVFAPNGKPDQKQSFYSISAISDEDASTFLLSYHEVEFLKAEAYLRLATPNTVKAKEAFKKAVIAALQKKNIALAKKDAEDYFDNELEALFDAKPLEEVMVQKYLAFYEEEAVEAYNDIRRLKAMGESDAKLIQLVHPDDSKFPKRFTYGSDDITTNVNVRDAYGDGSYVYSEAVWWAGGNR